MKRLYKILRNLIVGLLLTVVGLYVVLYVALQLPVVQNYICRVAGEELSRKTGGKVVIGSMDFSPFNELELNDVTVDNPEGERVMKAGNIGAGISLMRLIFDRRLVFTYAEISRLEAHLWKQTADSPLNIQFLIDAFKSKEKKEPAKFDLVLNNIILRDCSLTWDKRWIPAGPRDRIDFNHLKVSGLSADLRLPVLKNDDYELDLRRLMLKEASGLEIRKLSGRFHVTPKLLSMRDVVLELPATHITLPDTEFGINGFKDLKTQILSQPLAVNLDNLLITPADFSCFTPALEHYRQTVFLTLDAEYFHGDLSLERFSLHSQPGITLDLRGELKGLTGPFERMSASLPMLRLKAQGSAITSIVEDFTKLPDKTKALITRLGDVSMDAQVKGSKGEAQFTGNVSVAPGSADIDASWRALGNGGNSVKGHVTTDGFELGQLLDNKDFGRVVADVEADAAIPGRDIKQVSGSATVDVGLFQYRGYDYTALSADVTKQGQHIEGEVHSADPNLDFDVQGSATLAGALSELDLLAEVRNLDLSATHLVPADKAIALQGTIDATFTGNNLSNLNGYLEATGLHYADARQEYDLERLLVESYTTELPHSLRITSDILDAEIIGQYDLQALPNSFRQLAAYVLPEVVEAPKQGTRLPGQQFDFSLLLKKDSGLLERFKAPVKLFEDLELKGRYDSENGIALLNMDVPYMLQGKDKIIRDTRLALDVDTAAGKCDLNLSTILPYKKGDITLKLNANARNGLLNTDISWLMDRARSYRGTISTTTDFATHDEHGHKQILLNVNPSTFEVSDTVWNIDRGSLIYADKRLEVNKIKVHRPGQYGLIDGVATASPEDTLRITLDDIDLDYVFETLAINYVQFGGRASGELTASALFSKEPILKTDNLLVQNIKYNHCVLGDALIKSHWDLEKKAVYLNADIAEQGRRVALIQGNIYALSDSLSLTMDADRVNVAFLQPFMAAFAGDVQGRASGKLHLFGTFKDIDLTGKAYADPISIKIDILNTTYTMTDSVELRPGVIDIKNVTIHDRDGHTALLNGEVRHRYFHDPSFDFTLTNAHDFLCYDTNAALNPIWYGTIYGTGSGTMHGVPGFIDIRVDMRTDARSSFTFVLDDKEEAIDYQFITFTDKRKEAEEIRIREQMAPVEDTRPAYLKEFEKKQEAQAASAPTRYAMDIRCTATPEADLTIVMDPVAGDRIRANGSGTMNLTYNSDGEMALYGTYTLDKGDYNFTMQDVIVREFKIREGSKITFSGDPLAADLDLTATYRVNTSLTDLDRSFATDRELNRTNVPVEAVLMVRGPMQSPDITFDIDLPTVSQDVASKVKSIISTEDMMSRQIVYLLALNRFYAPDYMSGTGNGAELSSLASATISTQLSSMLGQLTPGWSFSPYFRSEKGDFSDMEVDLALSSSLFNNRLLLNGNLGYRDKASSSTTFVGDFDLEYLLNPSGTLRLKAYNHYNDQNYYLRSALTTQGIGILFKKDFNHFLPGLFRRHKKQKQPAKKPDEEEAVLEKKD